MIIARSAVASRPTNTNTAADGVATEPNIYRHDSSFDALITPIPGHFLPRVLCASREYTAKIAKYPSQLWAHLH